MAHNLPSQPHPSHLINAQTIAEWRPNHPPLLCKEPVSEERVLMVIYESEYKEDRSEGPDLQVCG
jgi:hypothetical protein